MTASSIRTRRRTPIGRRLSYVYGFATLKVDPDGAIATGPAAGVEVGYVGKTVQTPAAREAQHRGRAPGPNGEPPECQPFSDLIVGSIRVIDQGWWDDEELAARETYWIHALKPRYNYAENLDNPGRIPIFTARVHRVARDQARGVVPPTWAPTRAVTVDPTGRLWPATRAALRHQVTWWLFAMAVLFGSIWRTVGRGSQGAAVAAFATVLTVTAVVWKSTPRRRRRRR